MARGRDRKLIEKRNSALIRRYYYWTEVQRLRFDDTLKVLSENEFFISEQRVLAIIRQCNHLNPAPFPKVRKPKISAAQLSLFINE
ncbi:transposase [Viscerimonas tarda]